MNNEDSKVNTSDDPTLLLVRGNFEDKREAKRYVKSLSQAVYTVVEKHGSAKLRCVGAASVNNAVKAVSVANTDALKRESTAVLNVVPVFDTVVFDDNTERTALVLTVKYVPQVN